MRVFFSGFFGNMVVLLIEIEEISDGDDAVEFDIYRCLLLALHLNKLNTGLSFLLASRFLYFLLLEYLPVPFFKLPDGVLKGFYFVVELDDLFDELVLLHLKLMT